jgi:endonuclease
MKHFNVITAKGDGGYEIYPMKEWLRNNPEEIPEGLDATSSTSHQLRAGLCKKGWMVYETPTEVQLIEVGAKDYLDTVASGDPENGETEESETAFALEYQLRDFIAQNISNISVAGKKLQLYVDPTGRDGIEYPTAVGPIDILAIDDLGAFSVFELKRAKSPDRAIGQLARYMGWIKDTIGKDSEVHGVIVAKTIGQSLRYAVKVMPNVSLFEYQVEFHLNPAHELTKS